MAELNIMCSICSEFYNVNDIIYCATICGHVFHYNCLTRWLVRSNTCPQCRANCHRFRIHRIYLNFGERTPDDGSLSIVNDSIQWIPVTFYDQAETTNPIIPDGAIKAGTDPDGNDAYVARVYYDDDLLPANYVPQKRGVYAPWGCRAYFLSENVEILVVVDYKWVAAEGGEVPAGAIATGYTEQGEKLYTGRAHYEGITLLGKVHPSHRVLYMPYQGQEVNVNQYEVLVHVPKEQAEH